MKRIQTHIQLIQVLDYIYKLQNYISFWKEISFQVEALHLLVKDVNKMAEDMEEDGYDGLDGLEDLHSDSSGDDYIDVQQELSLHGI